MSSSGDRGRGYWPWVTALDDWEREEVMMRECGR